MQLALNKSCSVCNGNRLKKVLDLGSQPLCDDLIKINSKKTSNLYPIEIYLCLDCLTAHQKIEVNKEFLFPKDYHYRAANTPSILSGMKDLVDELSSLKFKNTEDLTVIDIGCNDGSLLNIFKSYNCKTIGVDPTDAIKGASQNHITYQAYFNIDTANKIISEHGYPDVITFTNSFAHIENFQELLSAVNLLMSEHTILIVENHYLDKVLSTGQFDTFYHEHVRTYSAKSFDYIAKSLSAYICKYSFPKRYGGNIRVFISKTKYNENLKLVNEESTLEDFSKLSNFIDKWKINKSNEIESFVKRSKKPMLGIAFPGRASIPINMLNLDINLLSATYEIKGSSKTGYYAPGTRIPIYPEADLFSMKEKPETVLNLAWHIEKDVIQNLKSNHYTPRLINII